MIRFADVRNLIDFYLINSLLMNTLCIGLRGGIVCEDHAIGKRMWARDATKRDADQCSAANHPFSNFSFM